MTITLDQFRVLAPSATPLAQAALFQPGSFPEPSAINRILDAHGITEPHVAAQFLAACSLASNGFTNFDRPVYGLSILDWLTARAREWEEAGANHDADGWLWMDLIDGQVGTLFGIPTTYWNDVHKCLATVCEALGVEDRSDAPLPLD